MPKASALPQSPDELLEQLFAIFPEYRGCYERPTDEAPLTFHFVLMDFTTFFGRVAHSSSEKQLGALGRLVSAAVEADGLLENAFGTCLLEHLHQIKASAALRPHLSKAARERTKA